MLIKKREDAIHGDLKPENILIVKDMNGEFSAKVADFGYSTLFAADSDTADVTLPTSPPWKAPEVEWRNPVTFAEAKSADMFSYGLICLWLLSYADMDGKEAGNLINSMKRDPNLTLLAWGAVSSSSSTAGETLTMEKNLALKVFFNASLSADPLKRCLLTDNLGRNFDCSGLVRAAPLMCISFSWNKCWLLIKQP